MRKNRFSISHKQKSLKKSDYNTAKLWKNRGFCYFCNSFLRESREIAMNNMPPITKNLLIINALCYLATIVLERYGMDLNFLFGLHLFLNPNFSVYQLFTYMFMHGGWTHLFFNMFAVWMFGRIMENLWGSKRFLIYYLVCGVGAAVIQELTFLFDIFVLGIPGYALTVGASGAVFGLLLAYGMSFPEERMFIFPIPIPIKAKWLILGYAVLEVVLGFGGSGDGVAHFAHLGGMLVGFLLILFWSRTPSFHGGSYGYVSRLKKFFGVQRKPKMTVDYGGFNVDQQYNMRKKEEQEEIDRILDKVRTSGYQSLTVDEKKKLFEASNK